MSTDWDAVCFTCKTYTHLGQRFTSGPAFGYGSNDAQGRRDAAEFVSEHVHHDLRIMLDAPDEFTKYELPADRVLVKPDLWGLHDGRSWLSLRTFEDHVPSNAPITFFTEEAANEFRESSVNEKYVAKPFDKADWEKHNS